MISKPTIPILLLAAVSTHAAVVIDDFTTYGGEQTVVLPPPGGGLVLSVESAPVLGDFRQIAIGGPVGPGGSSEAGADIGGSEAGELVNSLVSSAYVIFSYDAAGLGLGVVFNGDDRFSLEYDVDRPTSFTIRLTDGLAVLKERGLTVVAGIGTLSWEQNSLAFPGVDLSNIFAVDLLVEPLAGGDVWIDTFALVPEPGVWAGLFALGLGAFAACRHQRGRGGKS